MNRALTESFLRSFIAINVSRIGRDSTNGIAIFHLAENLTVGSTYFLGIRFRGSISDEPKGLYRVALHSANGRLRYVQVSEFPYFLYLNDPSQNPTADDGATRSCYNQSSHLRILKDI